MSNNVESDRSISTSKMYPIDLAPQKITIVKSVPNTEVKMAHVMPCQPKTTSSGQILTHASPVGLLRPAAQIITPSVASQQQMIVSGSPIHQNPQIISQGQSNQIISQPQLISPSGQLLSPGTQIISQGTQLSAQSTNNNVQTSVAPSSATQVLNVGGQLMSGQGNLVVNPSVRTLPPVRLLPPLPHHNTRPAVLSNVSTAGGVLVSKGVSVTSHVPHVPRGLAAGASLAIRQVAPTPAPQQLASGNSWSGVNRGPRGVLYGTRAPPPRATTPRPTAPTSALAPASALATASMSITPPIPGSQSSFAAASTLPLPSAALSTAQPSHSAIMTLATTSVLTSGGVIAGTRNAPRAPTPTPGPAAGPAAAAAAPPAGPAAPAGPAPPAGPAATVGSASASVNVVPSARPLPLLQRNYQSKVVGVASVGVRGVVGNSAPTQLYYEVPRALPPLALHHQSLHQHPTPAQVSVVNTVSSIPPPASITPVLPRPSILRKRDIDGSPTKTGQLVGYGREGTGWEDVPTGGTTAGAGSGGSTTISASSSPAPDDDADPPRIDADVSPRKKPRKQILSSEVRQCEFPAEETPPPPSPSPVTVNPPPKRPLLSSSYVCGWRGTALHFVRPADVRRREPRASDILAIASQKHVLNSADGWKVHHLTAQMDDLVSLEADVGEQLAGVLRSLETASGRALHVLQPHSHTLLELLKGNIQRSKIVCEGIQEARDDILRVFTHRNFVSDILTRQADKRCFRKHRSQS
ncbi:histone deacetylase complex subunit SAP130 [Achroia grisella]|uniref:histone deacetylase complex subunit SAP130 n=1 Tax=Achroia grisella TaxID=688607 RepID=UPI0027D29A23|nr:histone deacetylase complex subunit SAP130 [Achroia grisella]